MYIMQHLKTINVGIFLARSVVFYMPISCELTFRFRMDRKYFVIEFRAYVHQHN